MQVAIRLNIVRVSTANILRATVLCSVVTAAGTAFAAPATEIVDLRALSDLEQRASTANIREQTLLYAELADRMTVLASHQIADGQLEEAEQTLSKIETYTSRMETGLQQSKSLKKTELLLHNTNRRLSDMVRAASGELKPHVQATLKRLNSAQTSLLGLIFAK